MNACISKKNSSFFNIHLIVLLFLWQDVRKLYYMVNNGFQERCDVVEYLTQNILRITQKKSIFKKYFPQIHGSIKARKWSTSQTTNLKPLQICRRALLTKQRCNVTSQTKPIIAHTHFLCSYRVPIHLFVQYQCCVS